MLLGYGVYRHIVKKSWGGWSRFNYRYPRPDPRARRRPTMKLAPVTAAKQTAFRAEMPKLRTELNRIWRRLNGHLNLQAVKELKARQTTCRARIDHWLEVLEPGGKMIRSPVRLWDRLNKLRTLVENNEYELEYLEEYLTPSSISARASHSI
jgi:hypothetical protein